ncbi:hypothetical protein BTR14_20550 [Rhizobium rhizosphaerae]|uniref:Uncharacterized protein n=1 Tax=Xaviernesmea rhizosphaerae TaxID=1672749 RepID=A0ABX3P8E2_9HYPH|nr:hypothetical protein [Xaviernesmea rhizosphaerae]OQP84195.1 hypothetical protein BTR14_20550 [Xaviernesmea rhizosphaerae]
MALTGVHVLCAGTGAPGSGFYPQALLYAPQWSETMTAAGTTARAAPNGGGYVFRVMVSAATYIATGANPDASQTSGTGAAARELITPEVCPVDRYVMPGDKLAWVLA